MKAETASDRFQPGFDVPRGTIDRLEHYHDLLVKWNKRINLVSPHSISAIWQRHFADSAQLWPLIPPGAGTLADLGSGAGLPGLVLDCLARDLSPDLAVTLIESDARKCAFLHAAIAALGLSARVVNARIEHLRPAVGEEPVPDPATPPVGPFDVITARALAPLDKLLAYAQPLLAPGGACLFPKGEGCESELTRARRHWHMEIDEHPSQTRAGARILRITGVARVR
ncbi:MAG: 16S rRNA (guanine(527)-N(7))-methyltransferase RsmG [Alphaproteobacteria bacterium]|nr:MAG: 16S rRNA (guanine(527)-N(7))-methyltransferase RsmG [Alphaproteobacteria bacterium]